MTTGLSSPARRSLGRGGSGAKGYLLPVLHAHLPFVRHPEHEEFLEEDWFYEAVTETYIPVLDLCERLAEEEVPFRLTISLSPTLCEMFADALLQERYLRYLARAQELAEREVARRGEGDPFLACALFYRERFRRARYVFEERNGRNLINGFRRLQDAGCIEITTCGATHGLLPLMVTDEAVRAQIRVARANYEKHFRTAPRGMWLPECAYRPAEGPRPPIDRFLREEGIRFFFLSAHGVLFGAPRPRHGTFYPVVTPDGVAAFGRDLESSHQVWSAETGYPGDPGYREFYRDLGFDAPTEILGSCLARHGIRRSVGIKYHRITGRFCSLDEKAPYDPAAARSRAAEHAGNFLFNRLTQVRHLRGLLGIEPVVVSPYDAELFGHWWFEGPDFLEFLFRKLAFDQDEIALATPSEILEPRPALQVVEPSLSTWGDKGYLEIWLNGANDWAYRHLHRAERRMVELARENPAASGLLRRALDQAARELLLAPASAWAVIMTSGAAVAYAEKRPRAPRPRRPRRASSPPTDD